MPEFEPIEARPAIRIPRQTEAGSETIRLAPLAGILSGPIFTRTRDIIAANWAGGAKATTSSASMASANWTTTGPLLASANCMSPS